MANFATYSTREASITVLRAFAPENFTKNTSIRTRQDRSRYYNLLVSITTKQGKLLSCHQLEAQLVGEEMPIDVMPFTKLDCVFLNVR